jgi:carbamate kinase
MLVVATLGTDVLCGPEGAVDADGVHTATDHPAPLLAGLAVEHHLVLVYRSWPMARQPGLAGPVRGVPALPLDLLDGDGDGDGDDVHGHVIERAIAGQLPDDRWATVLSRIVVDGDDPAFGHPDTPVGPLFDFPDAERLARAHGWAIAPDVTQPGWRRVVASPQPRSIAELGTFRILVDRGVTAMWPVDAVLPVVRSGRGRLHPVEAAIDADVAAAVLARELDADALLLLTDPDVDDQPEGRLAGRFEAALRFVRNGGWLGAVVPLCDAAAVLHGEAPTRWAVGDGVGAAPDGRPTSARVGAVG